jgi:high frequency lysogenization protein
MVLERKLMKRKDLLDAITAGIDKAESQREHFGTTHENVIASLADLYTQTISTLQPRIIVNGEHNHVSNPSNANKIRALLLAAIRSAVLWRQCGGTRWQLLFNRKAILAQAQKLLDETTARVLH